ncbi:uncharacterized protein ACA1_150020 [Acanthamoeba castellanii str. Neff]|uniref:Uncharacterized protein n=1 Tax=Acanthamoeba castellanii (strain ATCC 30010 / Neff) TaxID=1257118 RepID=L8HC45_ACACF|nr:uncharacterized protein ACA1_150020 [Acanthamoeba castellanii str. Neff]ELR22812.1 hypothetical protein ACA1_150020 [Acanthamoeba castellanii str. Neff]
MSKKQGKVLRPASFENPLHRSDQGKGVKPIHPSTTDPKYTPPSFQAAGKGEDADLLQTEEDEALRDQSYAIGALPDDIESRELGQMHGDVRHFKKQLSGGVLEELRETPQPRHDSGSLVDKEDKALLHDRILAQDPADGLPYNE